MAISMWVSNASAQVAGKPTKLIKANFKNEIARTLINESNSTNQVSKKVIIHPKSTGTSPNASKVVAVTKVDISTSSNTFGSLISEAGVANYNSDVNVLSYTNRKSIGLTGAAYNSGTVQTRFSLDYGVTWDTSLVVFSNLAPVNRYPQGAILNPPGNTVPLNSYAVATAPLITSPVWNGGTFGSIRLDNTNASFINLQNDSTTIIPQWMPRLGMCSGSNGNAYALGDNYDINATAPVLNGFVINRGVWNAVNNNLDWDQKLIYHAFAHDPTDNSQLFSTLGNIAFAPDGITGYLVTIGRDSINDYLSPMPIIYHTTDAGASWSLYGTYNFTPIFDSIFTPNANGLTRPFYTSRNGFDVAVDANGKLHILCEVAQAASNHVDSLNYATFGGNLFDTYEAANGQWGAVFAGAVAAAPPEANTGTVNPNSFGWTVSWDARAQICRSASGTKMAYIWSDTETSVSVNNEQPNLIGASADFTAMLSSNPINYTLGGTYDANNYWEFVSVLGWDSGSDFVVPTFTSRQLNSGGLDTDPWMHQFVSGVKFSPTDYINTIANPVTITGIKEVAFVSNTTSIYPNPASGNATINVDLKQNNKVTITVLNLVGQVVETLNVGDVNPGKHAYSLDLNKLNSGLYLVNISIGSKVVTQKLNVQN